MVLSLSEKEFCMKELSQMEIENVNGGALPVIVYVGVKWTAGAFAAGFVGKAGADFYDYLFGSDS
jgi:lactobin A/cerein 7B family class IIb bacteriocin